MGFFAQSDLACEFFGRVENAPKGCATHTERIGNLTVERTGITADAAARKMGRPIGTYVSFHAGPLHLLSESDEQCLIHLLVGELLGMASGLTGKLIDRSFSVFVAGLGNDELTADAIGPRTVRRLHATRHLQQEASGLYRTLDCCAVSLMAPGVLGQTGIETAEVIRGTVKQVRPDLVVLIDALTAAGGSQPLEINRGPAIRSIRSIFSRSCNSPKLRSGLMP